jgi:hypothetical protein
MYIVICVFTTPLLLAWYLVKNLKEGERVSLGGFASGRTPDPYKLTCLMDGKVCPTNSSILSLSPQLDEIGVLRIGGRLRHAPLPRDRRHPILLPRHSRLTTLIIWDQHTNNCHAQLFKSIIQKQFRISRGKDAIRCLNSRPMTPVLSDFIDLKFLNLGHFLIGIPMKSIPDPDL